MTVSDLHAAHTCRQDALAGLDNWGKLDTNQKILLFERLLKGYRDDPDYSIQVDRAVLQMCLKAGINPNAVPELWMNFPALKEHYKKSGLAAGASESVSKLVFLNMLFGHIVAETRLLKIHKKKGELKRLRALPDGDPDKAAIEIVDIALYQYIDPEHWRVYKSIDGFKNQRAGCAQIKGAADNYENRELNQNLVFLYNRDTYRRHTQADSYRLLAKMRDRVEKIQSAAEKKKVKKECDAFLALATKETGKKSFARWLLAAAFMLNKVDGDILRTDSAKSVLSNMYKWRSHPEGVYMSLMMMPNVQANLGLRMEVFNEWIAKYDKAWRAWVKTKIGKKIKRAKNDTVRVTRLQVALLTAKPGEKPGSIFERSNSLFGLEDSLGEMVEGGSISQEEADKWMLAINEVPAKEPAAATA